MKRPEKKKESGINHSVDLIRMGYNEACDDWERFLPGIAEISRIIRGVKYVGMIKHYNITEDWADEIATAISERLRANDERK